MMTWLLAYLLAGFVGHWCATQILRIETSNNWGRLADSHDLRSRFGDPPRECERSG